ncbi:MAG: hypothetical protein WAS55_08445 [Saprospiraceae bacterium]
MENLLSLGQLKKLDKKTLQEKQLEACCLFELFEVLESHSCKDQSKLFQDFNFALSAYAEKSNENTVRAVGLMYLIADLYSCIGRHQDLITKKSMLYKNYVDELSEI